VENEDTLAKPNTERASCFVYLFGDHKLPASNRDPEPVTFSTAINGYSKEEVQAFLKQSRQQAQRLRQRIERLTAELHSARADAAVESAEDDSGLDQLLAERDEYRRISEHLARELFELKKRLENGADGRIEPAVVLRAPSHRRSSTPVPPPERETVRAYRARTGITREP